MAQSIKYPTTQNFVQKTLGATMNIGANVATLSNVTSIQNLPGVAIIDRIDTNSVETPTKREVITFTGTSGVTLTGVVKNADGSGTDQVHAIGAIVEFGPDVIWAQSVMDGLSQVLVPATGLLDTSKVQAPITTPSGTIVGTTDTQTLTNKILTSPVINTGVSGTAIDTDGTLAANSDTVIASQKAIKTYVTNNGAPANGWITAGTFTYASADAPTYVITVASGAASIYNVGDRIKLTDSTVKYFIITAVADTSLTVYGGTDYTLSGGAITLPFYSHQKAPLGFPTSPIKWSQEFSDVSDRTQASPTTGTWYNIGTSKLDIPIGAWRLFYFVNTNAVSSSGNAYVNITLSTANNSQSDAGFSTLYTATTGGVIFPVTKEKFVLLAAKTTYYLNMNAQNACSTIQYINSYGTGIIKAVCAYL